MALSLKTAFSKFAALAGDDKTLLLEALVYVVASRLALWTRRNRKIWEPIRVSSVTSTVNDPARIAWAVRNVARLVPAASCLTQALAGREMLRRRGVASQIRLGVAATRPFSAHAWLVKDGQSLLGGSMHEGYKDLGALPDGSAGL